jgi:hypothetical protein
MGTRPGRRSHSRPVRDVVSLVRDVVRLVRDVVRLVRDVVRLVRDVVPPIRACSPPGMTMPRGSGTLGLRRPGTGLRRRRGVTGSALGSIR